MLDSPRAKKGGTFLLKLIPYFIAAASAISAVTPNDSDNKAVQSLKLISDLIALNVGHNSPQAKAVDSEDNIQ